MKSGKVLTGNLRPDGYMQVNIPLNGYIKEVLMHVIICYTFHGPPPDETYTVDHIDRNKANNSPSNLRWASKSEQSLNRDEYTPQKSLIAQIKDNKIIEFYTEDSIMEIFDVDHVNIPSEGIVYQEYLWISEKFTDLYMINELWAPISIDGFIAYVSNMGRVQTKHGKSFGSTLKSGYKTVYLNNRDLLVHKLVVTAFRGSYDPKLVVNHIDRDKENNKLDNLEVITASENSIHAVMTGHKSLKPVQQISLDGNVIATFSSIQQASDTTNIIHTSIGKAANGKQKTAGGFIWQFVN